ncbi:glioma pathogenesis-related protein 1 [Pempheris klunzingeri]|uniref:glioma pathogenesis-related protein 1 n=1 Tax=Pempheris klunzingeri TaxID=3127111 RepID=UPI003981560C
MGSTAGMLLWAWILLDLGVCSVSLPEITDRSFIDECVREHNRARSAVTPPASNMLTMTWDEDLARTARAWAERCVFKHSPDVSRVHPLLSSVGENIWAGYPPSDFAVTSAMKDWVNEKQHYGYESNSCNKVCGHYTQVVWANSHKVGCAAQLCLSGVTNTKFATKEGVIFVCNYAPMGNVNRRRPYDSLGAACSGCEGTCVDNLCNSNYVAGGTNYVAILIVRPLGVIFTFITAYAVRHFYPDVFCYE